MSNPALVDVEVAATSVSSTWKTRRPIQADQGVQVMLPEIPPVDKSTNTIPPKDAIVQTEDDDYSLHTPDQLRFDGWTAPPEVVAFLRRCSPVVESQLRKNAVSLAFEGYNLESGTEEDDEVGCILERTIAFVQAEEIEANMVSKSDAPRADSASKGILHGLEMPCTAVSWNCTGNMLAAAFGMTSHSGWCQHKAGVAVWDAFKRVSSTESGTSIGSNTMGLLSSASSPVEILLPTSSCISSIAYHPEAPSILAAGTHNGEVLVWDTSKSDEPMVAKSRMDDYFHREPVSCLHWVFEPQSGQHLLTSASGDGKVLFWSLKNNLEHPVHGHMLFGKSRGLNIALDVDGSDDDDGRPRRKGKSAAGDLDLKSRNRRAGAAGVLLGVTSLAIPPQKGVIRSIIAGTEGGGIFRCQSGIDTDFVTAAAWPSEVPIPAARVLKAGTIPGADTSLQWERAAASALLRIAVPDRAQVSRAVERAAREAGTSVVTLRLLYNAHADTRMMYPNPIDFGYNPHEGAVCGLASANFNRHLFASAGADGQIQLFSSLSRQPLLRLACSPKDKVVPVTSVAWSLIRPCVLGATSSDGSAYLFDLYTNTSKPTVCLSADGKYNNLQRAGATAGPTTPRADSRAALDLCFNPVQRRLVAVADAGGRVRVWKMSWTFGAAQKDEERVLNLFVSLASDEDGTVTRAGKEVEVHVDGEPVNSITSFLKNLHVKLADARDVL